MKLTEITPSEEKETGTYAGVKFSKATEDALNAFIKENKIPEPNKHGFHTTLLYSRKNLPNYKPKGKYQIPMNGVFEKFDVWKSQSGKKNILVMQYSCPVLYQRHHKLLMEHGASYDFDRFEPHISLSYDFGDVDLSKIPEYTGPIEIIEEYHEDLNES